MKQFFYKILTNPFTYFTGHDNIFLLDNIPDFGIIYAPVSEGEVAGFAYVLVDDAVVGRVPVVFGETVEQIESRKVPFWKKLFGCDK